MYPSERLFALYNHLESEGFDGFLVPREDCFQSEFTSPSEERLKWLTGFTGSAGLALVVKRRCALFVDGRYTLQAPQEIFHASIEILPLNRSSIQAWLKQFSEKSLIRLAYDPWIHTPSFLKEWQSYSPKIDLTPCSSNPIDVLWQDRPVSSSARLTHHSLEWSGEESASKCERVLKVLEKKGVEALLITNPESIAWLLNLRGRDLNYTPIFHAFALLHKDKTVDVFLDLKKTPHTLSPSIRWHAFDSLLDCLKKLKKQVLWIDPKTIPLIFLSSLDHLTLVEGDDPILLLKAIKNDVEIQGARKAHHKDGLALVNFFAWLCAVFKENKSLTEIETASYLFAERQKQPSFHSLSFETISATGPHGAIVHYHPTAQTNAILKPGDLYLVDSGGQYKEGTTDVTRTVWVPHPTIPPKEEQKEHYTRVLKGHIKLARAVFPEGTTGHQLDALARYPLWQIGLDYNHGTGHGVGSFLNVHEGPQRISKVLSTVPLKPGMILSNEPGYYKEGGYGIRLENLVLVIPHSSGMLAFETLTKVPFDRRLIQLSLLTDEEKAWVNAYHQKIWEEFSPELEKDVSEWLFQETRPL